MAAESVGAATRELLAWLAPGRTYVELMDAWSSWCPRHSVWEDAVAAGLVRIVRGPGGTSVELTESGRAALA